PLATDADEGPQQQTGRGVPSTVPAVSSQNCLIPLTHSSPGAIPKTVKHPSVPQYGALVTVPRYNTSFPMRIHVETTSLEGVLVLSHPDIFEDERGFFLEVFRADEYAR